MCGNVEARGGELPFSQAMHGDREARAFDRYYLFRAYRLRQVQQRFMGRIGYGSIEKYLTSSEMPDIVGMELEGTPMVFRKRTPRQSGQLRFCIKTHFQGANCGFGRAAQACLRISGDIKPPGTIVPGGFSLSKKPKESSRGPKPSRTFNRARAACVCVDQALTAPEVMPSMYSLELKVNIISSGTVAMTKPAIIAP